MYLDEGDRRPPTNLRFRGLNPVALLGGLGVAAVFHGVLAGVLIVAAAFSAGVVIPDEAHAMDDLEVQEVEFVQRPFVKLGREFQPRELPNRQRAARTTAPNQPSDIPNANARRVQRPEKGPTDSVEDMLARLGTRADEQARIAEEAEREGNPEGIEEGTETEGDAMQIYQGQLYAFFRRGFNMPTSIPQSERAGLRSIVTVTTGPGGEITNLTGSASGNAEFDQAVRLRLDQARGSNIPTPPEEIRDQFYGAIFRVGMRAPR